MATGNHLLDGLSAADLDALRPSLKRRRLEQNQVLAEAGEPVVTMILPVDAVISVIVDLSDGRQAETRTIGREGGFGLLHALGSAHSYETVIDQIPGEAYLIDSRDLAAAAQRRPSLTDAIVRHAQAAWVQSSRTVACNAFHDVRARLCRWLLITQDRTGRDELPLTHEHLSIMLCVQRTTATTVLKSLKDHGAIDTRRGRIVVRDRSVLMNESCDCYSWIERNAGAILSHDGHAAPYLGPA